MKPENEIANPASMSMDPFPGPWTKAEAAHLLRRTMFGPTNQQILDAVSAGMVSTVATLLQIPAIDQPLTFDPAETIAPQGATWVTSLYPANETQAGAVEAARLKSLGSWIMKRMNTEPLSIAEKMCLFWHNHFGVTASSDSRSTYNYLMLIRQHALGNIKQLIKDMTVDPCMLQFLNGGTNTVYSPNENYARELLELFTIGKGEQIGEGDYSTYTEQDVAAGARILTGYIVQGMLSSTVTTPYAVFDPLAPGIVLHDTGDKQLSYHFNNQIVSNGGATEYADYIDIIFGRPEVATFLSKELYKFFVNYDITATVATEVIPVMAQTMIDNNYEVAPVLEQLFCSQHFYDEALRGSLLRSPLDMLIGMLNATETTVDLGSLAQDSNMYLVLYAITQILGQAYAEPPSVAGWPAYYQAPAYYQLWVNATTIKSRFDVATGITVFTGIPSGTDNLKVNALGFLNNLSNPANANQVIDDICDVLCPKPISAAQKLILKNILTDTQGDTVWQSNYNMYANNPGNTSLSGPIALRVNLVLNTVFKMPQFHTI